MIPICILFFCQAQLDPEVQARLVKAFRSLDTFQLHFVQVTYSDFFDDSIAEGNLVVARPGRMRMTYNKGDQKLIIWDGETAYEQDQLAATEWRGPMDEMRNEPLVQILLFGSNLTDHFLIDRIMASNKQVFRLRPRQPSDYEVMLELNSQDLPRILEVVGADGEGTRFHFSEITLNPTLKSDTFQIPAETP